MVVAPPWVILVFVASKELLAELTSKPKTSAVTVAITPAPSFTTSCESLLR